MRRRHGVSVGIGVAVVALAVTSIGVMSASAQGEPQVTLCHATGSEQNPYVEITVDQSAVFNNGVVPNGHGTHTGPIFPDTAQGPGNSTFWGDIIPAFGNYPGLNVPAGQAILDNGCEIPGPPPTTQAPPPTTQAAPPPTQAAPPPTQAAPPPPPGPSVPVPVRGVPAVTG